MRIFMVANDTTFIYNLRREVLEAFAGNGHKVTVVAQILSFREELEQMGLSVPAVTEVAMRLKKMGFDLPPVYTVSQAADAIMALKGGAANA